MVFLRDRVAEFVTGLSYDALPRAVVDEVKRLLVDHVASMLAGPRAFAAEMPPLPALARARGGAAESTIVGVDGRYPCTEAAFSNTAMGFTGIDAWHKPSTLHVPASLFSAVIAVAEREGSSGRDLITALVAGAEVMIRASLALGPRHVYARGFHPTSICAPLGCAAAASRLIGLDAAQTAEALSTAAVHAAGSSIWRGARTPATFCVQIGRAAEGGVLAALLAAEGCYGVDRIFEDPRGFFGCYSASPEPQRFIEGLGDHHEISRLMMHQYWFGPYLLTSIESLLDLLATEGLEAGAIRSMEARVPTTVIPLIGAEEYPRNRLATLTTLRYALAVVSHVGPESIYDMVVSSPRWLDDAGVRDLFDRVAVVGDEELDAAFPGTEASILTLRTRDGRTLSRRHDGPVRGDPDNPMDDAEITRKFEVMAGPSLPGGRAQTVIDTIMNVDDLADINALTARWSARG